MPEVKFTDKIKQQSVVPIVVFISTSTQEKIRDFKSIAKSKNYPIIFEDIHQILGSVHNADENGKDYTKNAFQKLDSAKIKDFRAGSYDERISNYLKARGIPLSAKIYIATEDGGFHIEKPVWDKVDKKGIPEKVLNRLSNEGTHTGPGVETAPIISSLFGEYNLMHRVLKAATDLHRKSVGVLQKSTLILTPIKGPEETIIFAAHKIHKLHTPDSEQIKDMFTESRQKISNANFTKVKHNSNQSLLELGEKAITEHSVRAVVVEKFYKKFKNDGLFVKSDNLSYQNASDSNGKKHEYRVASFGALGHEVLSKELERTLHAHKADGGSTLTPVGALISDKRRSHGAVKSSYQTLSNVENIMSQSDSIILFPDTLSSKKSNGHSNGHSNGNGHNGAAETSEAKQLKTLEKLYVLFSLEVAKQLNPRDAEKAIIILNHDGSWNEALALHNNLANLALTKEYTISLPAEIDKKYNVSVQSNSYYDVIGTPNGQHYTYDGTVSAAVKLLSEKSKRYTPRAPASFKPEEKGDSPDKFNGLKVALFCSASSESKELNNSVKKISHDLAANNYGIIYGGGDRYTMGAVLDGVGGYRKELMAYDGLNEQQAKSKTYVAGYSTKEILNAETTEGKFSEALNYYKRNDNIYHRMADMLDNSDIVVAAAGGAGTVQEWAAALILNHGRAASNKKPVVFFNPELNSEKVQVWNVALKTILGEKDYNLLTSKEDSQEKRDCSRKHGIYVETTEAGLQNRINSLREEHKETQKSNHFRNQFSRRLEQQASVALH